MKYKVIDWETLNTETLQQMLDDVYQEGFQDGYQKGVKESVLRTTLPDYNYNHYYDKHEITCSNSDCCCKF